MPKTTVTRFSDRVENYVKYRPAYPGEILELFKTKMNFSQSSTIADIGSGTGISSRLFLEQGNPVFGIEPNSIMRDAAKRFLSEFSSFCSIDGTAEYTTLDDNTVDLIIAAQAFHWFNDQRCKTEFRRIIKEKGFVALIWNERQLDSNAFLRDYECFLIDIGTDYETVRHDKVTKSSLEKSFECEFFAASFRNSQTLDFEGFRGRMLSASYVPSEDHMRFRDMMTMFEHLFARHEEKGKIHILYDTNVFYGQI